MKMRLRNSAGLLLFLIIAWLCVSSNVSAGVTGRLKGKVVDKDSQEVLPNAVVKIEGTYFETISNADGEFSFIGIDAGTYEISVKLETYANFVSVRTTVPADQVTEMVVEMIPASDAGSQVIAGYSNSSSQTGSYQTLIIPRDKFVKQPYRNVGDIVTNSTASVYQRNGSQYVRAGAPGEMGYYMDGILLNDGFAGEVFSQLPYSAIDHIAINTGGFESKYGNFGSGIAQIIPKRGGDTFQSSAEYVTDAAASVIGSESYGRNIFSLTFSGPIIKNTLHFFAAGELSKTDDSNPGVFGYPVLKYGTNGVRNIDPTVNDTVQFETGGGGLKYRKSPAPGNANSGQWTNLYGNISYNPNASLEVDVKTLYSLEKRNVFQPFYLLTPDRVPHSERFTLLANLSAKYNLSPRLFVQGQVSYYSSADKVIQRDVFEKGSDAALMLNQYFRGNTGSTTYYNDNLLYDIDRGSLAFQKSESASMSAGLELGWNWNEHNFIQTGFHSALHTIRFFDLRDAGDPYNGSNNYYGYQVGSSTDHFNLIDRNSGLDGAKEPIVSYFFVQDEFTWEILKIDGGMRFDHFNTGTKELKNISNPTGPDQRLGPEDFTKAKSDVKFSPRFAVSAKAATGIALRAIFGWYYQVPAFEKYYVGSGFLERQSIAPPFSAVVGNSSLKLQKTELTELGLSYSDQNKLFITAAAYWKNIDNLVGTGLIASTPNGLLINGNYDRGHIDGVELSIDGRITDNLSSGFTTGLLNAKMRASGMNSGFRAAWRGYSDAKFNSPLDYEQEETVRLHALYQIFKKQGPSVTGIYLFENMEFYAIGTWQSGFPYTPTTVVPIQVQTSSLPHVIAGRNSKNMPSTFSIDIKAVKQFYFGNRYHASIYIEILNLLNRKNVVDVFAATGKGNNDGFLETPAGQSWNTRQLQQYQYVLKDNFHYSNPRLVNMGIMLEL